MKKIKIVLASIFMVMFITGISLAAPIPFQVGTSGYLDQTVTSGLSFWESYKTLGTDTFYLNEGETSASIDFFEIKAPLAMAKGKLDAYVQLVTPDINGYVTNSGNFSLFSFIFLSNGSISWEDSFTIPYSYNGLTNGSLLLTLNDIPGKWQYGSTFTISGYLKNIANPVSVPEPATILLFGFSLMGLLVSKRNFVKK